MELIKILAIITFITQILYYIYKERKYKKDFKLYNYPSFFRDDSIDKAGNLFALLLSVSIIILFIVNTTVIINSTTKTNVTYDEAIGILKSKGEWL